MNKLLLSAAIALPLLSCADPNTPRQPIDPTVAAALLGYMGNYNAQLNANAWNTQHAISNALTNEANDLAYISRPPIQLTPYTSPSLSPYAQSSLSPLIPCYSTFGCN